MFFSIWVTSFNSESQSDFLCFNKKAPQVPHCKPLYLKGCDSASTFILFQTLCDIFMFWFDVEGAQMKWHQRHHNKQLESMTWDRKQEGVGSDFISLETTFMSQQVSLRTDFCFFTFQTHTKVLQLYLRLQDRFYGFCHFLKIFIRFKMFASMSVQNKAAIFSFSLLDEDFLVSTTVHFLYLQTLFKR